MFSTDKRKSRRRNLCLLRSFPPEEPIQLIF
jgi:hypothetical protein